MNWIKRKIMDWLVNRIVTRGLRIPSDEEMKIAVQAFGEALRRSKQKKKWCR